MRVVEITRPGGPEVLRIVERPAPTPGPGEVVVRVVAAGVNRPDVQQRRGLYPPPENASDIPGLDISGIVEAVGEGVTRPRPREAVCALANGGGYADFCAVPAVQCMPVPKGMSFVEAASLPEVFFTVWNTVIWLGRLAEGESMLVQGGTSGVGMATIQIARKLRRATVYATAGSSQKRAVCLEIGAQAALDYKTNWDDEVLAKSCVTRGRN
jgi:NADPH:quinone reductase